MNQIEIDIIKPPAQGYGWSVSCTDESCDDFGDKMLSYEGAQSIAKAHRDSHKRAILITEDGPDLLKAMFPIGGSK